MSTNIFKQAATDPDALQEQILGPNYSYADGIKNPSELGMSSKGDINTLGKDIDGLVSYIEVLVTGSSDASKTGGPLGNKFFMKTGGKCVDKITGQETDRYVYMNNVPQGNIPFLSSSAGMKFDDMRGLIPGAMGNLAAFNPFNLLGAFASESTPECQQITLETIDSNNSKTSGTYFVATADIKKMDPCEFKSFMGGTNPETGEMCDGGSKKSKKGKKGDAVEEASAEASAEAPAKKGKKGKTTDGFTPMTAQSSLYNARCPNIERDPLSQAYIASLGLLGIYLAYKIMYYDKRA